MKKLVLALFVLLILVGCEDTSSLFNPTNPTDPTGEVVITDYEVSYGYLTIYFTLKNTSSYEWNYYEIYFDVETTMGTLSAWTNGLYLESYDMVMDWTMVYVGDTFKSVTFDKLKVTVY